MESQVNLFAVVVPEVVVSKVVTPEVSPTRTAIFVSIQQLRSRVKEGR